MKKWFELKNQLPDSGPVQAFIYDYIGYYDISALDFVNVVAPLLVAENTELELHINSRGGDIFEGLAIFNWLKNQKNPVTVYVDGLAASIASVVAMAADVLIMPKNSYLMIHEGWGGSFGRADELRSYADVLDSLNNTIANIYSDRSGVAIDEIRELMSAETWFTATVAVEKQFADMLAEPIKAAACAVKSFRNAPQEYLDMINPKQENSKVTIEELQAQLKTANDARTTAENSLKTETEAKAKLEADVAGLKAKLATAKSEHETAVNKLKEDHGKALAAKDEEITTLNTQVEEYKNTFDDKGDNGTGADMANKKGRDLLLAKAANALK